MSAPLPAPLHLDPATAEAVTGGAWHGPRAPVVVRGATLDSREVRDGCLFACFEGERVDGHDYAEVAVGAGAVLILARRPVEVPAPVLVVSDVAEALAALAQRMRSQLDGVIWIGVTGSNGKTTVKELLGSACSVAGPVHITRGNYNNHLGVPLTILATPAQTRIAVIEMGTSGVGEIGRLAAIVSPTIGVLTSIGPAHLEGLGGLSGVAVEKAALLAALPAGAPALLGRHGMDTAALAAGTTAERLIDMVRTTAANVEVEVIDSEVIDGDTAGESVVMRAAGIEVGIPMAGPHNLANAWIAWRAACAAGCDPRASLRAMARVGSVSGRLSESPLGHHCLLDDSYNANPASMIAGLGVLAERRGARLAVLGAMGELGPDSDAMHQQVGAEAARLGLSLVTVGAGAVAIGDGYRSRGGRDHQHTADRLAAFDVVSERLAVGPTTVLIKASRSAGLDALAHDLVEQFSGDDVGEEVAC